MKIIWTATAIKQERALENYLLNHWSSETLRNYQNKLASKLQLLSLYPEAGVVIKEDYRRINVTSQSALIYRIVRGDLVIILMLWDNRQKPIW